MLKKVKSIRTKILLPTITILLLSLSTVGGIASYLNYSSTVATLEQTMTETVTVATERITVELDGYRSLLTEVAGAVCAIAPQDVLNYLDEVKTRHQFTGIALVLPDGTIQGSAINVADRDYFTVPRDQKVTYVSDLIIDKEARTMNFIVSAPIIQNAQTKGVVFGSLDATLLTNIAIETQIGATGNSAIIDKDGKTIAYEDIQLVLDSYCTQDEMKADPKLEKLAALEREVMAGKSGFGDYSYDGITKYMAYAPVANTNGWGMYVTVAKDEFLAGTFNSIVISMLFVLIFILIAIIIFVLVARSISKPIIQIQQSAIKMASGDYDIDITHHSKDELGSLADSMRQMTVTTKQIILDTVRGLNAISEGNFDIAPQATYIGVYEQIADAMKKIIRELSSTIYQIRIASDQVSGGANQVSAGAQALAQGATQQASSVEQLSASIAEVSAQISSNADNAKTANEKTGEVCAQINTSNEQMTQMISAMQKINHSSAEIGKIIKTIEDIAFQTNILALNAAVEAARAGAAGKGFAVVADEVRNLASKSAEAAKQTNVLIEDSVTSVQYGVKIADTTAQSLVAVVSGAEEITRHVQKISQACTDQSTSIAQINLGVEQISSVVQTNSATSEQSAAASEELSSQASIMNDLVSRFKLLNS